MFSDTWFKTQKIWGNEFCKIASSGQKWSGFSWIIWSLNSRKEMTHGSLFMAQDSIFKVYLKSLYPPYFITFPVSTPSFSINFAFSPFFSFSLELSLGMGFKLGFFETLSSESLFTCSREIVDIDRSNLVSGLTVGGAVLSMEII